MSNKFLMIDKEILPEHFGLIIEIKELINLGLKISDACKKVGLSRSTFYKYKDYVYLSTGLNNKKANILIKMKEGSSLIALLMLIEQNKLETVNIHKETLVNNIQEIFLTLSTDNLNFDYGDLIKEIKKLKTVKETVLLSTE